MKIHVTAAEGFEVKDHTGTIIPQTGVVEVELSPKVEARLREGLLIEVEPGEIIPDEAASSKMASKGTKASVAPAEEQDEGEEDQLDLDEMTKAQICDLLTREEIKFDKSATKAQLIELAVAELGESEDA